MQRMLGRHLDGNKQTRTLTRGEVIEVLNRNLDEASIGMTTRRFNKILTDLGFELD